MSSQESNDVQDTFRDPIRDSIRVTQSTSASFQAGQAVGGRYEVISRLGEGGMGLVYRVKQVFLNKEFALKTIDKRCMSDMAIRRFQQEARTAFSLDHPNIVAVNDFGILEDDTPFLTMELINGETLGDRLRRTGSLTLEQAIPIFVQVCFGLAYAHECGVVHRDIKPNNIMLLKGMPVGSEGSIKILDFGIAKFTEHQGGEMQALTRTGEIFGSPLYMSPEQCSGARVDHRADIYSLGCVLFEALTGTPPFMGDTALTTMMMHQGEKRPTLKEASLGGTFPQAIEDIVATMLAQLPEQRYQNLGEVAHDLGALKRGDAISDAAQSARTIAQPAKKVSSMRPAALLVGVAITSACAGYWLHDFVSSFEKPKAEVKAIPMIANATNFSKEELAVPEKEMGPENLSIDEMKKLLAEQAKKGHEFSLGGRTMTDALFDVIANAQWIKVLNLHNCILPNKAISKFAKMNLNGVEFDRSDFNNVGAEALSHFPGLHEIRANGTPLTDKGIASLATMPELRRLSIADDQLNDASLSALGKSKSLEYIELKRVKNITSTGLKELQNSNVRELDLDSTLIDDSAMPYLSKMSKLKVLNLSNTKVTVAGIEQLLKSGSNCKSVVLIDCANIGPPRLRQLRARFPGVEFR